MKDYAELVERLRYWVGKSRYKQADFLADDLEEAAQALAAVVAERDAKDARIKVLVAALDRQHGTPCEQIRHQQEIEALKSDLHDYMDAASSEATEVDRLNSALAAARAEVDGLRGLLQEARAYVNPPYPDAAERADFSKRIDDALAAPVGEVDQCLTEAERRSAREEKAALVSKVSGMWAAPVGEDALARPPAPATPIKVRVTPAPGRGKGEHDG